MQRMAVMTYSLVKEGVAFTLPYLAALLTKIACEEEGKQDIVISRFWACRFVHKLGLSKKKVNKTTGVVHDKKERASRLSTGGVCSTRWFGLRTSTPSQQYSKSLETVTWGHHLGILVSWVVSR
eukprot:1439496-Amphidinium_carterae.1